MSMKCNRCDQNEARYVSESGSYFCGLCDLKLNSSSVRISDLPELLVRISRVRDYIAGLPTNGDLMFIESMFEGVVCRKK